MILIVVSLSSRQEFWNDDTGEIICNMTAKYGDEKYGPTSEPFNELNYITILPCIYGHQPGKGSNFISKCYYKMPLHFHNQFPLLVGWMKRQLGQFIWLTQQDSSTRLTFRRRPTSLRSSTSTTPLGISDKWRNGQGSWSTTPIPTECWMVIHLTDVIFVRHYFMQKRRKARKTQFSEMS